MKRMGKSIMLKPPFKQQAVENKFVYYKKKIVYLQRFLTRKNGL